MPTKPEDFEVGAAGGGRVDSYQNLAVRRSVQWHLANLDLPTTQDVDGAKRLRQAQS